MSLQSCFITQRVGPQEENTEGAPDGTTAATKQKKFDRQLVAMLQPGRSGRTILEETSTARTATRRRLALLFKKGDRIIVGGRWNAIIADVNSGERKYKVD